MSTTTYDPRAATAVARSAAEMRLGEVESQLSDEYEEAVAMATDYALHLADGGEPWRYPQPEQRGGNSNHGLARAAREAVFDTWNETRERKSLTYPWGGIGISSFRWRVHERLLDSLDEAVTFHELARVGNQSGSGASPKEVANAVWQLQVMTQGQVRVRKTKVAGKSAYLARLPRPGDDELTDDRYRDFRDKTQYSPHVPYEFPTEEV